MEYVDSIQAAKILGWDPSTVRKHAGKGVLTKTKSGKKLLFPIGEVNALRKGVSTRKDLGDLIRELFVLRKEGSPIRTLSQYAEIPQDSLELALGWYTYERRLYFNGARLPYDKIILPREAAARLKIVSKVPIYNLVREGRLQVHPQSNGNRYLLLSSWLFYIGKNAGKPLYTSREVLRMLNGNVVHLSLAKLDTIAYQHGIGIKIQDKRMSTYLFAKDDIERLRKRIS